MKTPDVFNYQKYLEFIRALILDNAQERGFQSKLCGKIACQPASLSRALSGSTDLTRDQIANLALGAHLNELEAEYLLCLYDSEISGSAHLRKIASQRIKKS